MESRGPGATEGAPDACRDVDGGVLLSLARAALEAAVAAGSPQAALRVPCPGHAWLLEHGATFVTLTRAGDLRGCIGSLEPARALRDDVRANAASAALADPRFPAVTGDELAHLHVEVSLLTPCTEIDATTEADLLARLRPGLDGLVLEHGSRRATFLPQVWEQLPEPEKFLRHLRHKAGMPLEAWPEGLKAFRYGVVEWREEDLALGREARLSGSREAQEDER